MSATGEDQDYVDALLVECGVCLCNGLPTFKGAPAERRGMCRAGFGTLHYRGWFHGPFTPFWEPGGAR